MVLDAFIVPTEQSYRKRVTTDLTPGNCVPSQRFNLRGITGAGSDIVIYVNDVM